jgi:hypothetical protein
MDMTTAPCAQCGAQFGSGHEFSGCKKNMHGLCGTGVGEEGYGQAQTCEHCAEKATAAGPAQATTALGLGV